MTDLSVFRAPKSVAVVGASLVSGQRAAL